MTEFHGVSSPTIRSRSRRGRAAVAVAAAALAALAAAGCSSASSGGGGGGAQPLSPHQAIQLASDQTSKINSMTMTIDLQLGSTGSMTGSMQMQLKPTLLMEADFNMSGSSLNGTITEIITDKALYMKLPSSIPTGTGKPWIVIDLTKLGNKAGMNFQQLFQQLENMGPQSSSKIFAESKDIHKVGTATINGVATTEYAGTISAAAALSQLPAAQKKQLGPMLSQLGSTTISFDVWIDGSNQMRKVIENYDQSGQTVTATIVVTSINQPVNIVLPPTSDTAPLPGV